MKLELQKGSRSKILAAIILGLMTIFVVRLFYLQIIQHGYYVSLANKEQIKRLTIPAQRGLIYGLSGQNPIPLVMNQDVYMVFADPTETTNDSGIIDTIEKVAGGNAQPNLRILLDRKDTRYQVLATDITLQQANAIKSKNFNGIGFQAGTQRVYPDGVLAAQVLGFVDSNGVGQYGVEGKLDKQLSGKNGLLQSVTDVNDIPLTIGNNNINIPAVNGTNEVLSIDPNIQSYTEQALSNGLKNTGATKGSAIVMDPQTGRILAMANLPSFDPAKYNQVQDMSVFNNGVVSSPYEPGSDMKTLTMATGIDKGVVNANSTYVNTGSMNIDGTNVSNFAPVELGTITLQTAMDWSLNSGFMTVAERLGDGSNITLKARNIMYDYFHNRFHLGELTGVEVSGEAPGIIIPPTDVQGNAVRYSNMAFGQGLDVTMLQVASAFCSIVNGGNYYTPTVLAGIVDQNGNYIPNKIASPSHPIKPSTAYQVRDMIHVARDSIFAGLDKPGYYIGGKTGTSQVIVNGAYSNNETIATYLGYGGTKSTSRYVIMVQVSGTNKILEGGSDAMPIFTDISNWMLGYLNIQPKG
jgi:cell division protein FtsI/penicillin-binding protein 2